MDRARNRALSPLYHVERIRIPLQVHQGANDSRVPRAQSDWLVQRLRSLGGSVEYFVYADEGHGFNRFENERLAWQRLVAFSWPLLRIPAPATFVNPFTSQTRGFCPSCGAHRVAESATLLKAGTNCGSCVPELKSLLVECV